MLYTYILYIKSILFTYNWWVIYIYMQNFDYIYNYIYNYILYIIYYEIYIIYLYIEISDITM